MTNKWIKIDKKNLRDGLNLMARDDMVKIVIDGTKVRTKDLFLEQIEQTLRFPATCGGKFSRFEDWIRDLGWISMEKGICIWITDYDEFLCEDSRNKAIIEKVFKDEVLPFWEAEVVHTVKGGTTREFYVLTS